MATINEIAKIVGCSTATVSKAMNNYPYVNKDTKKKILDTAKELGFTPNYFAKTLMSKRTYLIGILIADEWNYGLLHPLFGGIVEGFKRKAEARNYELLFIKQDYLDSEVGFVEHYKQRGIEGVFIVIANLSKQSIYEIADGDLPCVSVDFYQDKLATVLPDNMGGAYAATKHLINLGHRKIAHIAGDLSKPAGSDRLLGYKHALNDNGIAFNERMVFETVDYTPVLGRAAMSSLVEENAPFSAVFAASDTLAMGAVSYCREQGIKVPDDMSVVGFDDIDSAEFYSPPLTTIRQNRLYTGVVAADLLIDMIETPENTDIQHVKISAELKERESTAPFKEK